MDGIAPFQIVLQATVAPQKLLSP